VTVVVDAADYAKVLGELAEHAGMTSFELRQKLAAKAYARTAAYDAAISNWFAETLKDDAPDYRAFGGKLIQALRYGENRIRARRSTRRRANVLALLSPAAPRQGAVLQQHQRHRRGL